MILGNKPIQMYLFIHFRSLNEKHCLNHFIIANHLTV